MFPTLTSSPACRGLWHTAGSKQVRRLREQILVARRVLFECPEQAERRNNLDRTMRQLLDVVATIALGAAVLLGIALMITLSSPVLELVALR